MNKKQNVQLSSDCKKTESKTLEAVSKKLETITLDAPNAASTSSQLQPQGSSNKSAQILKISETSSESKLVSNNNHRTPIGPRYKISMMPDGETKSVRKNSRKKSSKVSRNGSPQDQKPLDSKLTNVDDNNKEAKAKNDEKESAKGSPRKSSVASSRTSEVSTQTHPVRISKPDPRTVCTCEILRQQAAAAAAAAAVIPKRVEPQNVPIYRWVSVKSEAAKTEEEKAAEIRLLLGNRGTAQAKVTTNTFRSTKPRLCPFCWNEKQKARREDELKRERELEIARQTKKKNKSKPVTNEKSNRQFSNRYGDFLDDTSA